MIPKNFGEYNRYLGRILNDLNDLYKEALEDGDKELAAERLKEYNAIKNRRYAYYNFTFPV